MIAFLTGDASMLHQADQEPELLAVLDLVRPAGIVADYSDLEYQLNQLDLELKQTKKRIEKARAELKGTFMGKLLAGYPVA